jgi:hypothetical protein
MNQSRRRRAPNFKPKGWGSRLSELDGNNRHDTGDPRNPQRHTQQRESQGVPVWPGGSHASVAGSRLGPQHDETL